MKTLLFITLLALPFLASSQMHLPGAKLSHYQKAASGGILDSIAVRNWNFRENGMQDGNAGKNADENTSGVNTYNAWVLSTNFTLPMLRINLLNNNPPNNTNSSVSTSFFNSVGAGLNISWGEIKETVGKDGSTASADFSNTIGLELGFLFAANTGSGKTDDSDKGSQPNNIFALMGGISVLNFQAGIGHEFGSVPAGQKRTFFTLSYSIPLSTLINGGFHIISANPKN
ncbi:MAG TPA: hypothetical protein VIM55_06725 [Mucilaginibacter sp.]